MMHYLVCMWVVKIKTTKQIHFFVEIFSLLCCLYWLKALRKLVFWSTLICDCWINSRSKKQFKDYHPSGYWFSFSPNMSHFCLSCLHELYLNQFNVFCDWRHLQILKRSVKTLERSQKPWNRAPLGWQNVSPCCYGNVKIFVLIRHIELILLQQMVKIKIF